MGNQPSGEATFFKTSFGFYEGPWKETHLRLLEAATLVPAVPQEDFIDIPTLRIPAERCVFRRADQKLLDAGFFYEPSVNELRAEVRRLLERADVKAAIAETCQELSLEPRPVWSNTKGDASGLHQPSEHCGSVFQAASQFNYLEFATPRGKPEDGITCYAHDHTQGPACARSCPAGTAYRNYLMRFQRKGLLERGQTVSRQRNGLADVEKRVMTKFDGEIEQPWVVRGGYIESDPEWLKVANEQLSDGAFSDELVGLLRVGVQQDTKVSQRPHAVTQVYSSAVSVGYSKKCTPEMWQPLACLVLRGAYEATLLVSVKNTVRWCLHRRTLPSAIATPALPPLFLTQLGGGVFANKTAWIVDAMDAAHRAVAGLGVPLDVRNVHYSFIDPVFEELAGRCNLLGDGQRNERTPKA